MKSGRGKRIFNVVCIVMFLCITAAGLYGAVPETINYQGYLTDTNGKAVNGTLSITFRIWDAVNGGVSQWEETHSIVPVNDGVYSVILGSINPVLLDFSNQYYLGVTVGTNNEMTPRQTMTSVASALTADTAHNLLCTACVTSEMVGDDSINSAKIENGSIGFLDIGQNGCSANQILKWNGSLWACANMDTITETDPQVGTVNAGKWCIGDGTSVQCTQNPPLLSETDPEVGQMTPNRWCTANAAATAIDCTQSAPPSEGHNHDNQYVNVTGDTMSGSLGVYSDGGVNAVYGIATATSDVTNIGGYFTSFGSGYHSAGVVGRAMNDGNSVENVGGLFIANGQLGTGVYGVASNDTGTGNNVGGYFSAAGLSGRGVAGSALNSHPFANNYGGYFESAGGYGKAIYGVASNSSGNNLGGYFEAKGDNAAIGVKGLASNDNNLRGYGGFFEAHGVYGIGVYGKAAGESSFGVYGLASKTGDIQNHGGYFVANGQHGVGVYGLASDREGFDNYGGKFENYGRYNSVGVYGVAHNLQSYMNKGGHFEGAGEAGMGVYARGHSWDFYADGEGINYGPFTGGHEVRLLEEFPEDIKPGMIVSVTGKANIRKNEQGKTSISSTLPTIKLSSVPKDKAVFGAIVEEIPLSPEHWYKSLSDERFGTVNALGEGRVWVTNINGEINAGDYITTSFIPGYGQKQDDDILHSYTLGKAIESVDWDMDTETVEHEGKAYKAYLIAVVYTSG